MPANPNTVKLSGADGGDGWLGRLGPGSVMVAFDVPLDVFAFDDSGV